MIRSGMDQYTEKHRRLWLIIHWGHIQRATQTVHVYRNIITQDKGRVLEYSKTGR
jgi:hypothetical protein